MTTFLSGDATMYKAYNEGKDLYAMIAMSAFDNKYEDNLEWYAPGKIIDIDGKQVVSGMGKEFEVKTDDNDTIVINYYDLLETALGEKAAADLAIGDKIISDIGELTIIFKSQINDKISFKFSL